MKKVINIFLSIIFVFFSASCSETITKYKIDKTQKDIYQNREELYKENY